MSKPHEVAVLVGSLRKHSLNLKLALALKELAAGQLSLHIVEIGDLPFYNEDLEPNAPAEWRRLRDRIQQVDALLFITPEYNRSVPAVLKNALDVLSRPYGKAVIAGKPAGVISSSPGAMGGFGANHHLRQSLVGVAARTMAVPEAYIGGAANLFDERGSLANAGTAEFLQKFLSALQQWIAANSAVR